MKRQARIAVLVVLAGIAGLASSAVRAGAPVDVNRATVTELMQLPGMTATWAARIVRYRPYATKLDLLNRGVVTEEVYRRIQDKLVAHKGAPELVHR